MPFYQTIEIVDKRVGDDRELHWQLVLLCRAADSLGYLPLGTAVDERLRKVGAVVDSAEGTPRLRGSLEHEAKLAALGKGPRKAKRRRADSGDAAFEAFLARYPRYGLKAVGRAIEEWKKLSESDRALALTAVSAYASAVEETWEERDKQFIPYPSRWLADKEWRTDAVLWRRSKRRPSPTSARDFADEWGAPSGSRRASDGESSEALRRESDA